MFRDLKSNGFNAEYMAYFRNLYLCVSIANKKIDIFEIINPSSDGKRIEFKNIYIYFKRKLRNWLAMTKLSEENNVKRAKNN